MQARPFSGWRPGLFLHPPNWLAKKGPSAFAPAPPRHTFLMFWIKSGDWILFVTKRRNAAEVLA